MQYLVSDIKVREKIEIVKKMQLKASKTQPPVGALITIEAVKDLLPVDIKWDKETSIEIGDGVTLTTNTSIARYDYHLKYTPSSIYFYTFIIKNDYLNIHLIQFLDFWLDLCLLKDCTETTLT